MSDWEVEAARLEIFGDPKVTGGLLGEKRTGLGQKNPIEESRKEDIKVGAIEHHELNCLEVLLSQN